MFGDQYSGLFWSSKTDFILYPDSGCMADSGSRLMLNPDPDFFVVSVPMIFADPNLNFSD